MKNLLLVLGIAVTGAIGCAPKAPHAGSYFPLKQGNEWSYEMVGPFGNRNLEFRVVSVKEEADGVRYLLDDTGERYYVQRGDSIAISVSPGIWSILIEGPLTLGKRFDGGRSEGLALALPGEPEEKNDPRLRPIAASGYKVVTGLDRRVTVPAGTFRRCLEITHVAGPIIGVKLFAPGVGLVLSESWVERDGKRVRQSRQALTKYQVKE